MRRLSTLTAFLLISTLSFGQLIINEVLYDPSNSGLDGDANGDGVYDQEEDSFIEFVNIGTTNFDASGYQIWDDTISGMLRFVVPAGTFVPPNGALVVFGSGPLVGTFGGAIVLSADTTSSHLNFNNSGEVIVVKDANGSTVLTFDSDALSNNPNESYTRFPDITGAFLQHGDTTSVLFSPGTMTDGTPFNTNFVVETITVQGAGGATTITTNAGSLQMEAMVTPSFAADTTVVWSVPANNGVATISASGLLQAAGNGMVYVKATANDGSGVADSIAITITNQAFSIDENAIAGLSVYPNPAVDKITIDADVKIDEVSIYSITGQLMLTVMPEGNRLEVSSLPKGLYLLKITSGDSQSVVRITKN